MSEIIPHIWNENLKLKKEESLWVERIMITTEIKKDKRIEDYVCTKLEVDKKDKVKIKIYDKNGELLDLMEEYMENKYVKVFKNENRIYSKNEYDAKENLISEKWLNEDGSQDETQYSYKDNLLVKIEKIEDGELSIEELKYEGRKLMKILSVDEKGKTLMERRNIYDNEGKLEERQRIQDEKINKRIFYKYDEKSQLIEKEEETISRLTGEKLPPEIYEYVYYENGKIKAENWIVYIDDKKDTKKFEIITTYNELGLKLKGILIDYRKNEKEITTYEYKMKK